MSSSFRGESPAGRFTALVVEDEALIAIGLETALADLGAASVAWATRRDEALRLIAAMEAPYGIAIVDWILGSATAEAVIAALAASGTPVLVYTGAPDRVVLPADGAIGLLAKPAHEGLIASAIRRLLNVASAHEKNEDDNRDRHTEEPE